MKIRDRDNLATAHDLWCLLPPHSRAAELGVAEGRFSETILAWPVIDTLIMVDRWTHIPRLEGEPAGDSHYPQAWHDHNYARALAVTELQVQLGRAQILRGDTVEMAERVLDGTLQLIYVDADHTKEGVERDIAAWMPKLAAGGIMAFDDYDNRIDYGVGEVVDALGFDVNITQNQRCAWIRP